MQVSNNDNFVIFISYISNVSCRSYFWLYCGPQGLLVYFNFCGINKQSCYIPCNFKISLDRRFYESNCIQKVVRHSTSSVSCDIHPSRKRFLVVRSVPERSLLSKQRTKLKPTKGSIIFIQLRFSHEILAEVSAQNELLNKVLGQGCLIMDVLW